MEYGLYFIITLIFSTLFGVVGVGSSLALIPIFTMLGVSFPLAKAVGLFANGITTTVTTMSNIVKKEFDFKELIPLLFLTSIFAILGAFSSKYIDESIEQVLFVLFILTSVVLLFFNTITIVKIKDFKKEKNRIYFFISIIAFVSGLLGLGGGALYLPLLIYFGLQAKKSIITVSSLIPFVSFSAFVTYASFVEIDWILIVVVSVGAFFGGYFGNKIMYKIKDDKHLKYLISMVLIVIAVEMLYVVGLDG